MEITLSKTEIHSFYEQYYIFDENGRDLFILLFTTYLLLLTICYITLTLKQKFIISNKKQKIEHIVFSKLGKTNIELEERL